MKKIVSFSIISILSLLVLLLVFLSTTGIETKRFNNLITTKIKESNGDINLILNTINFKLDLREISLFLEAKNPIINFKEINLPTNNIKAYINFISLLKSENKFEKISLNFNQISFKKIKMIAPMLKLSNFSLNFDLYTNQNHQVDLNYIYIEITFLLLKVHYEYSF